MYMQLSDVPLRGLRIHCAVELLLVTIHSVACDMSRTCIVYQTYIIDNAWIRSVLGRWGGGGGGGGQPGLHPARNILEGSVACK